MFRLAFWDAPNSALARKGRSSRVLLVPNCHQIVIQMKIIKEGNATVRVYVCSCVSITFAPRIVNADQSIMRTAALHRVSVPTPFAKKNVDRDTSKPYGRFRNNLRRIGPVGLLKSLWAGGSGGRFLARKCYA